MTFKCSMTKTEAHALDWLADRYSSAEALRAETRLVGAYGRLELYSLDMGQDEAQSYLEALRAEFGPNAEIPLPTPEGSFALMDRGNLMHKLSFLYGWAKGELPEAFNYDHDFRSEDND